MNALGANKLTPVAVRTLLIVGGNPDLEERLKERLPRGTWAIVQVPDNASVLAAVKWKAFDVVLTSEHTSAQEDVELLRKLRRIRPHTRLIILTDESTPKDVIRAMREHAFSYFSKPYSVESLAIMVQKAIEQPGWDDGIEMISATPEWIRLRARCDLHTADRVVHFFDEVAELPDPERTSVGIAIREMLLNAIEHGGNLDPNEYVEIGYVHARHMVTCRISDPGEGFVFDEVPHAAIHNPADDPVHHVTLRESQGMRPGGFGILLARHMVDELIYGQNGNDVLLVKYLQFEEPARKNA
jgi:anti-sigma regulatory factor (Ser/Thr protein kinase)/CheY-like chemotaxis protein